LAGRAADAAGAWPGGRPRPAVPPRRRRGRRGGHRRGAGPVSPVSAVGPVAGSAVDGPWVLVVTPESAGWGYPGLRGAELPPGGWGRAPRRADGALLLPLAGSCTGECGAGPPGGGRAELGGRSSVFAGPTDCAYLPAGSVTRLSTVDGGRFAVATARADRRLPFRYLPAEGVPVELRGAGPCSRQVHNFGTPQVLDAVKLIACGGPRRGGSGARHPPHKHDEERQGELPLEEIYYFEVAGGGMAYQRVYGTPERPIDVLAEVRTGDVVLVPHGWHGPSMAAPGYDLYYLNVMAGPAPQPPCL